MGSLISFVNHDEIKRHMKSHSGVEDASKKKLEFQKLNHSQRGSTHDRN